MFNNIVYLNRDQDTDRRQSLESDLEEYGIKAVRYAALNDGLQDLVHEPLEKLNISFAQASCLVSHLEIIRTYGDKQLLVFEDDIDLSPSKYWGTTFEDIVSTIDESIGIVQMYSHPTFPPITPKRWAVGMFGTIAYFIQPWYAQELTERGYKDGKWQISALRSHYVQPVADSVLYSNTDTISITLFGLKPFKSTILPHATYIDVASTYGQCWKKGLNNIDVIKDKLSAMKRGK